MIGSWPARPGLVETSNRAALGGWRRCVPHCPPGPDVAAADFAAVSAAAFDRDWVGALAAMAHSIELLFDPETEARSAGMWDDLAGADYRPAPRPSAVTLAVAERIDRDVDQLLRPLPSGCR